MTNMSRIHNAFREADEELNRSTQLIYRNDGSELNYINADHALLVLSSLCNRVLSELGEFDGHRTGE